MLVDFTPQTDIERAFAQAAGWAIDKLWIEADRNGDREDWVKFFGQSTCLTYHCAVAGQPHHLKTITEAMISNVDRLTEAQRRSWFNITAHVACELRAKDLALESIEMQLVLRLLCFMMRKTEQKDMIYAHMLGRLSSIIEGQLDDAAFNQLADLCEKTATNNALLSERLLEAERTTRLLLRRSRVLPRESNRS